MSSEVTIDPKIDPSWLAVLREEFAKPYFVQLKQFLLAEKAQQKLIYPPGPLIFQAYDLCPFDKTRVVILGQDPYHGKDQAHGLAFSVNKGVPLPPSLRNIFKELHTDTGAAIPSHGDLSELAKQGVLLLNTVLTVQAANAFSHQKQGWEQFTDATIHLLSEKSTHPICFVLWGAPAKKKRGLIDETRHLVLTAAHPSPLSAHNGFFGCRHFSQINRWLEAQELPAIKWG